MTLLGRLALSEQATEQPHRLGFGLLGARLGEGRIRLQRPGFQWCWGVVVQIGPPSLLGFQFQTAAFQKLEHGVTVLTQRPRAQILGDQLSSGIAHLHLSFVGHAHLQLQFERARARSR